MESIKNPRKKKTLKLMLCFRPAAMDDGSVVRTDDPTDCSGDPVFKYIAVRKDAENDGKVVVPMVVSSFPDERLKVLDEDVVVVESRRRKKGKVSRILKAVFFETSLAKKIGNRKARKNSSRSNSNKSTNDDKSQTPLDGKAMPTEPSEDDDRRLNSKTPSSSHPSSLTASFSRGSSSSSLRALNSGSLSDRKTSFPSNSMESKRWPDESCNYGLCLLLISLLVLIFWGRICAIFCTSTWLFFVPRRRIRQESPENVVESPPLFDSVEHKKRVIMEGLLGRSRTRVLY
ncbi:hypothetical protein L1049_000906 [Liquidambar formosana]|uniref:Uncharacterized protein n=1 Tax=Liquidambar formosana TaxID=63359 RepID=A0AAP0NBF5_LIQFO